jgi:hypothetical protein
MVCVISGFFVTVKGRLFIPLRRDRYLDLQLNQYALKRLADKKVRSSQSPATHSSSATRRT